MFCFAMFVATFVAAMESTFGQLKRFHSLRINHDPSLFNTLNRHSYDTSHEL